MADPYRILLVDDEPSIIKTVGRRLEIEGFEVVSAADGEEAIAKTKSERPHLIVLDLMMPKVDGLEVCKTLKQDAQLRQIPIVVLTARTKPKDEQEAMAAGADAYVRKPFRSEELISKIRSLITPS